MSSPLKPLDIHPVARHVFGMSAGQPKCEDEDLVIIGGGHSGLLLALALSRHGVRSTIVDADPIDTVLSVPFDGRALALMQGSKKVFDALDLWPHFESIATPIRGVRVSDKSSGGSIAYDADEVGGVFGYGLETRGLRQCLLKLVLAEPAIQYLAGYRLQSLSRDASGLALHLGNGKKLLTPLAVGADGRRSALRHLAGIDTNRIDYHQTALTFAIRHAGSHENRVHEFMSETGPLALLPIGPDICSVTWIEDPSRALELADLEPACLLKALRARQDDALSPCEVISRPAVFPLSAETARSFAAPCVALVGDAAHGLHPIHAQGWNLGVRDVAALTEVLVMAKANGRGLGSGETLQRYARWREADARTILGLTDGLNRLFSTSFTPAKALRRAGLSIVDNLPPLKNWLMRRGMGVEGDLPKLARGERL